jgi:hypothetical protein
MRRDGLELYIAAAEAGDYLLYVMRRSGLAEAFSEPTPLSQLGSLEEVRCPVLSPDGLTLAFRMDTPERNADIFSSSRSSTEDEFSGTWHVEALGGVGSDGPGGWSPDMKTFYYDSSDDIFSVTITKAGGFENPEPRIELNSEARESRIVLSADGLTIYFMSSRNGNNDIFIARRQSLVDTFSDVSELGELNSSLRDHPASVSPDNCSLIFASDRERGSYSYDLFLAERQRPEQ